MLWTPHPILANNFYIPYNRCELKSHSPGNPVENKRKKKKRLYIFRNEKVGIITELEI